MAEELKPDICVIGGGPAGIRLAVAAANAARSRRPRREGTLGGANLADGGVPSKALIAAASEYETLRRGPAFGVSGAPLAGRFRQAPRPYRLGPHRRRPDGLGGAAGGARRDGHRRPRRASPTAAP